MRCRVAGKYWRIRWACRLCIYPGNEGSMFLQNVGVLYLTNHMASYPTSTLIITAVIKSTAYSHPRGDPKITGIIFLNMVYLVLYYCNSSLLQSTLLLTRYTCTVFPTAENNSGTLPCWCCSSPPAFSSSRRWHQQNVSLSSGLSYEGTGKVAWRKVWWTGRMRDNRHAVFLPKTAAHSRPCGQRHCRGEGTNHRCYHISGRFFRTLSRNLFNAFK